MPGFTIIRRIDAGGSSTVYEATQDVLGRKVALKVLDADLSTPSTAAAFTAECKAAGCLSEHANVVAVYDGGVTRDGTGYLAMALCQPGSLAAAVRPGHGLDVTEVLSIGVRIGGALASAHAFRIVHCDVKPENILLDRDGSPRLSDFGIAKVATAALRDGGTTMTRAHAPPEAFSIGVQNEAGDIYSLGSTLHHLLTGAAPFGRLDDEVDLKLLQRITREPPPPIGRSDVPAALEALLCRAMAKDPHDRPPSMRAFGEELQTIEARLGRTPTEMVVSHPAAGGAPQPPGDGGGPPLPKDPRRAEAAKTGHIERGVWDIPGTAKGEDHRPRPRWPLGVAAALLVAVALGGALLLTRPSRPKDTRNGTTLSPSTSLATTVPPTSPPAPQPGEGDPGAPTEVTVIVLGSTQIRVSWKPPPGPPPAYFVVVDPPGSAGGTVAAQQGATEAVVEGLDTGARQYCLTVNAVLIVNRDTVTKTSKSECT